ncbi:Sar family guanine nucleotide exchange factor SEC12 CYBJADRAFT_22682 [Cyberlindnera jadinii NRRL Y-1542]|uniref:Guanine nucleotide-exchange factor SEC12 n=1 Tax=Cyberlindnera jadinii (strain ATCC 18201 / CBS 1600 / BCRC 20928 / JCM 3617 / NBRC 0987 / NRRL Y-1542) TaxID=983966 RepID=A0A1E4RXZ8_CYBJN|nr:hypothetical protein CYBJADRAFT_22682 [Cyberlindnera jadinii NRRL Y-1542]ODV72126.1 hypothetical protein CYBJADRAFT_22682 [Cyberlindnera jadinii NRRL Y-1542]
MKFNTAEYDIGYPVFDAKFLNDKTLLVTGGGHSEPGATVNRLTALTIQFEKKKKIKKFRELKLSEEDDIPYVLDAANNLIFLGANESAEAIRAGHNHNLRKFVYRNDHLVYLTSASLEPIATPLQYQKLITLSEDGVMAATATSKLPTVIHILSTEKVFEKYEIETNNEVKDMDFSPDGKMLTYITPTTLEIISSVTGKSLMRKTDFQGTLSKVKFQDNNNVLVTYSLPESSGVGISRLSIRKKLKVVKDRVITKKIKGITTIDINVKNGVIALAGNENSVILLKSQSLKTIKIVPNVHGLSITKVCFTPNGKFLATVSAAKTIKVLEIPDKLGIETHRIYYFFLRLFQLALFCVFASGAWFLYYATGSNDNELLEYFTLIQKTQTTQSSITSSIAPVLTSTAPEHIYEDEIAESVAAVSIESTVTLTSEPGPKTLIGDSTVKKRKKYHS